MSPRNSEDSKHNRFNIVLGYHMSQLTIADFCNKYIISEGLLKEWIEEFATFPDELITKAFETVT